MMVNQIRHGSSIPLSKDLQQWQLGYCDTNFTLYIKDGNDNIINLTTGHPSGFVYSGLVRIDGSHSLEKRYYKLASIIIKPSIIEGINFKFECSYFHKIQTDLTETKTEVMIGTVFNSIDFTNSKKSTNIYGSVTNLINKDLHLLVNYNNNNLDFYFIADNCREGFCRIYNVEVLDNILSKINYYDHTKTPEPVENFGNSSSDLFPYIISPING